MRGEQSPLFPFCLSGLCAAAQTEFLSIGIIDKILLANLCNLYIAFIPKWCYNNKCQGDRVTLTEYNSVMGSTPYY